MQPSTFVKLFPLAAACGLLATAAQAQTTLKANRIITGVSAVTWVGSPPTDDRIFVTEQTTADIKVFTSAGAPLATFLNLTSSSSGSGVTVQTGSERGLLSLAFDPNYATNGFFYIYYTALSGTAAVCRIQRYTVLGNPLTSNTADPASALTILEQAHPQSNHNGGNLQFGPDGFLYFAFGDGGGAGDTSCNAQNGLTWLGKMLRIDVHGDDFPADPIKNYAVPGDNPFVGDPNVLDEIYHLGLRNPWRWFFDPHTGDMFIGDVGQDSREEVDFAPAGQSGINFGWKIMEGFNCFSTSGCSAGVPTCGSPALTLPIHDYSLAGSPCAVIGGVIYRGCAIPEEYGTYFFAEHCANTIWSLHYSPGVGVTQFTVRTAELTSSFPITSINTFGYDHNGEVLIGDSNEVFRIEAATRSFLPDVCNLSVSAGGVQNWTLNAGGTFGGQLYLIGGSLSGIAGIPAGSVIVPLTPDAYTLYTLAHPNQPPLFDTFAVLNPSGGANARFDIGPGLLPPSLVGTRAYHAYASLDGSLSPNFASNPVAINFLP
jgi:glucose/arabinose dehydrogenase